VNFSFSKDSSSLNVKDVKIVDKISQNNYDDLVKIKKL